MLSGTTSKALDSIISKFKSLKIVGFVTFNALYYSRVVPIMDYCSEIWAYGNLKMCNKNQQFVLSFYLGVHPNSPLLPLNQIPSKNMNQMKE